MGKAMKSKRSRNISFTVLDDTVRDKILKCQGKLSVEIPNTPIWINEDVLANYRRRKSMLRDIVKVATAKKYRAKIDQGGVNINGKLYLPHQFDCLPVGIRPQDIMCKTTVNDGLAFASKWAQLMVFHMEVLNSAISIKRHYLKKKMTLLTWSLFHLIRLNARKLVSR